MPPYQLAIAKVPSASRQIMVRSAGFEPTTTAFGGRYSIQLSYERMVDTQTSDAGAVRCGSAV